MRERTEPLIYEPYFSPILKAFFPPIKAKQKLVYVRALELGFAIEDTEEIIHSP